MKKLFFYIIFSLLLFNTKGISDDSYTVKEETSKEVLIWLENEDRTAVGIIVKTKKGAKRIRQGKGK